MKNEKTKRYTIIRLYSGGNWGKWTVHEGEPLPKVRELLGGQWSRTEGSIDDGFAAFWNNDTARRVFVMAMPSGLPLDAVYRVAEASA